jgi:hypothetical protein
VLEVRWVPDSAFETPDMDRRGVASCPSRGLFSIEFGRLDNEGACKGDRLFSVDARGVENMSTAGSSWECRIGDMGEELAELSRGSRAYSSLKTSGFGIRIDVNCGRESLGAEDERSHASEAIFPLDGPAFDRLPQLVVVMPSKGRWAMRSKPEPSTATTSKTGEQWDVGRGGEVN